MSSRPGSVFFGGPTRRGVLGLAVGMLKTPLPAAQSGRAGELLKRHASFDLHCHPGMFPRRGTDEYAGDGGFAKTTADMRAGGLSSAFFSLVADAKILKRAGGTITAGRSFAEGEGWVDCEKQLAAFEELARREKIDLALTVRQMEDLRRSGQVAAFLSCEGGDCLEGRVGRLETLYRRGVRSVQLVHYAQNTLGDLQTQPPVYNGLSPFGREVVREMGRLGMVVDVAHAAFSTVKAVVDAVDGPIILSHSHLQSDSKPHPRLITKEHAKLVASTGGVIGAWPSGFVNRTFADFVDNTMRLVDAVGVDHVGLGTDMDGNFEPVFSSYRQLPDWVDALLGKGLPERDVAKLAGGNALRVLRTVLKG